MEYMTIIISIAVVAGLGVIIGVLLGVAGEKFKVPVDEKEVAVRELLPGLNCGGCGFPGCDGLAAAIAKGEAPASGCPVGGPDVAAAISGALGIEADTAAKKVAFVKCAGDCEKAKDLYEYVGPMSCKLAQNNPNNGPKACTYGCTGYGSCKAVCDFGAIDIVNGIAVINRDKCVACGKCVAECPRNLIELIPFDKKFRVQCNSRDKGKEVKAACSAGCIGCSLCARTCHFEAITVENNIAHIDYDKCKNCSACAQKCPVKIIG